LECFFVRFFTSSDNAPEDILPTEISLCEHLSKLENCIRLVWIVPICRRDAAKFFFPVFPRFRSLPDREGANIADNFLMFMTQSESFLEVF
jgi:hypothetical protein